jgi:hypothetical protein
MDLKTDNRALERLRVAFLNFHFKNEEAQSLYNYLTDRIKHSCNSCIHYDPKSNYYACFWLNNCQRDIDLMTLLASDLTKGADPTEIRKVLKERGVRAIK